MGKKLDRFLKKQKKAQNGSVTGCTWDEWNSKQLRKFQEVPITVSTSPAGVTVVSSSPKGGLHSERPRSNSCAHGNYRKTVPAGDGWVKDVAENCRLCGPDDASAAYRPEPGEDYT